MPHHKCLSFDGVFSRVESPFCSPLCVEPLLRPGPPGVTFELGGDEVLYSESEFVRFIVVPLLFVLMSPFVRPHKDPCTVEAPQTNLGTEKGHTATVSHLKCT